MKNVLKSLVLLALVALIAMPLAAAEKEKKGKKKGDRRSGQVDALLKKLESIDLSDEQSAKIKDIAAKFSDKIADAQKKLGGAMKEIASARKKAADEGKKGKELEAAATANLTDEQKEAYAHLRELNAEFRKAVAGVLTAEQQEKAGLTPAKGKGKRKKGDN